jgi:putative addiction module component (TIGR02574 family)
MGHKFDIKTLTAEERLALLGYIWDSLEPEEVPVTDAQRAERASVG